MKVSYVLCLTLLCQEKIYKHYNAYLFVIMQDVGQIKVFLKQVLSEVIRNRQNFIGAF